MRVDPDETMAPSSALMRSVLREIARGLEALASTGETNAIDLRSLPLTEADREALEMRLGHGEIAVALDLAGASEAWETRYSGVWWIRHFDAADKIAAERIEITTLPDILLTHGADITAASSRLRDELAAEASLDAREDA